MTGRATIGGPPLVGSAEQAVRDWLAPGRYRTGDRLPPEHELAAMLGISRGTLRSALQRLEATGEIVRRQGSGTFVGRIASSMAFGDQPRRIESYSAHARPPELRLTVISLRIERRSAGPQAARALAIGSHDRTTVISRTLAAGGVPAVVARDVFHSELPLPEASALRRMLRDGQKIFDVLAATGVAASSLRTTVSPVLISPQDPLGRRLKLGGATACLELEEVVHTSGGEPILYSRDVCLPGGIEFEVRHSVDAPQPLPIAPLGVNGSGWS